MTERRDARKFKFTARAIDALRPEAGAFLAWDETLPGLVCKVYPTGAKTYLCVARVRGTQRKLTLEPVGVTPSLDRVREKAKAVLAKMAEANRDPGAEDPVSAKRRARQEARAKRAADANTFGALCETYIETYAKPRKRSWKADAAMIRSDIPEDWKARSVVEITRRDVVELIDRKAVKAPIQANRVRALLHKLFRFAIAKGRAEYNPVYGTDRPTQERSRDRVLATEEVRRVWTATEKMPAPMRALLRLQLVTAQRYGEVLAMRWSDIDLAERVWTVPATVAKNKLSHRVPLSELALEILDALPRESEFVVAGARGRRQYYEATAALGLPDFRGHDLRRTAASGMASLGVPRHHISRVLNHVEAGVTAVYDRHGYDSEKRAALDSWARKLRSIVDPENAGGRVLEFSR